MNLPPYLWLADASHPESGHRSGTPCPPGCAPRPVPTSNRSPVASLNLSPYRLPVLLGAVLIFVIGVSAADWTPIPGARFRAAQPPAPGRAGFTRLDPAATGVRFTNHLAESRFTTNQIYLNGSGLAAGDVDGDGRCDLFFAGLDGPNRLFRNLGDWKFEDVTEASGVALPELDASGAVLADVDGDGDLDLIVNSVGGGLWVLSNDGQGRFRPSGKPLNLRRGGTSVALADLDGDGALDLYVGNYRTDTIRDQPNTRFRFGVVDGKPVVSSINGRPITDPDLAHRFNYDIQLRPDGTGTFRHEEQGEADALYRNDGRGGFVEIPFVGGGFLDEDGLPLKLPPFDWTLSVLLRDLNQDGTPDIYICSDFKTPDRMWLNDGRGRFRAAPRLALRHTCLSAMAADVADINRDGLDDLFVADMYSPDLIRRLTQKVDIEPEILRAGQIDNRPQYSRNTLSINRGDGTYLEIAHLSGLEASDWTWSPVFLDVDLDGFEDLLIANGFERDNMNVDALRRIEAMKARQTRSVVEQLALRREFPRLDTPNLAFRNLGNLKFAEIGPAWGFDHRGVSQAMVLADLDNDGDLDVVVGNLNGPAWLYRNESDAPRIAVRLRGLAPNTHGIGARITLRGGKVTQSQEILCGGRYLSSDDSLRVFAAGPGDLELEVRWRSGRISRLSAVLANRIYEIDEAAASAATPPQPTANAPAPGPLFTDVSHLLDHLHVEEPFDDFANHPLLPYRLSQSGPGLAWLDLNADGTEDLVVGAGRSGRLGCFLNQGPAGFTNLAIGPWNEIAQRDQTGLVGVPAAAGRERVLAGASSCEDGQPSGPAVRAFELGAAAPIDIIPSQGASTGALALADFDGDGDLDLFVGGRMTPSRYPEPATSTLWRNQNGRFTLDAENSRLLQDVGLVNGAVFSDLTGDGLPELVLACEWGPLRVYGNEQGRLRDLTAARGLARFSGWWTGVTAGDFDGDGKLDLVAGNWGQNTRFERYRADGIRLLYGDLNGDDSIDLIEAWFDPQLKKHRPLRPLHAVERAQPYIREFFGTCEAFAKATLDQIYSDRLAGMRELRADWLETTVFLNRGDRFEPVTLPLEAQVSPAFATCVADANGDGYEDVFLSQNLFAVPPEVVRHDAGRGLWLLGDGRGAFRALTGSESGVFIYGEQRGAAVADYDADGRVDLAVAQNAAATRLFRNVGAQPGLRVRLRGGPANPRGIGAVLRLHFAETLGPARELHAGSGYWSQDSAIQVLGCPQPPTALSVRWPGGRTTRTDLPANAASVTIDLEGRLLEH